MTLSEDMKVEILNYHSELGLHSVGFSPFVGLIEAVSSKFG